MSEEIKACPFPECVDGIRVCIERKGGFFVFCHGCNARGPACDSELTAILRWNAVANQLDMLRNKVEILNKNLIETTDRAMVAEVQRDEAREWARRLYHGHPMWRMSGSSYVPQSPEWLDDDKAQP